MPDLPWAAAALAAKCRGRRGGVAQAAPFPSSMSDPRPRVYYDEDCGFCRWTLAWVLRWDRKRRLRPVPIQSVEGEGELGDLGRARLESAHLVRDGERWSGGAALAPLLEELPGGRILAPIARRLQPLTEPAYRCVAHHRSALSRLVPDRSKARAHALVESRL
jgi:predicted DCC family thiol-disulfide oxidoreductase YuxK